MLRLAQQRLEQRVDRAESMAAVVSAKRQAPAAAKTDAKSSSDKLPSLTVVKLKPKAEPAPKIDTSTPVVEPPPELVDELAAAPQSGSPDNSAAVEFSDDSPATAPPATAAEADRQFEQSMDALRTGNLNGAGESLERFADENPRHPKADNALYFAALGYQGLDDEAKAAALLERLLREYPAGDAVQDALLKLAECRLKLKEPDTARRLYHQVISTYPGTAAADRAQARLATLAPEASGQ